MLDVQKLQNDLTKYEQALETARHRLIENQTIIKEAQKEMGVLQEKCKTQYGCDIGDLPVKIAEVEKTITESITILNDIDISVLSGETTAAVPVAPQATEEQPYMGPPDGPIQAF